MYAVHSIPHFHEEAVATLTALNAVMDNINDEYGAELDKVG